MTVGEEELQTQLMEMEVVACQAPTEEKMELVDTQAPTVENRDMVNPAQTTKLRPSFLTLRYKINGPKSKIIPFLPKKPIEKSTEEPVKFGRTETFDVFLNDECMSRNYVHIYAERKNPSQFKVVNFSTSKPVIVDNKELWQHDSCYIKDKSVLHLDIVTFFVSLRCGDKNAGIYVVSILPEIEDNQQLYRSPGFQMQNFGNCNVTCCHTSANWPPVSPQIHNSSNWPPVSPQIHNSSNWPPVSPQIHNSSNWPPVSPQIQNSSNWPPVSPQIHNSSNWPPVSAQIHNPCNGKPEFPHLNRKGLSQRQPQEHSMPSEDALHTEKQRQYQFIEDLTKKQSF